MSIKIKINLNMDEKDKLFVEKPFNNNFQNDFENIKENLILKKIKKHKNYPNYLISSIDNEILDKEKFKKLINLIDNLWAEGEENSFLTLFDNYFNDKNHFNKYCIWFYINLNYFRNFYLTNKEIFLKKYFQEKFIFYKNFNNIKKKIKKENNLNNSISKKKYDYSNYSLTIMKYINLLKFMKKNYKSNSEFRTLKLNKIMDNILLLKQNYNEKILDKLALLSKNFNNNEENLDLEYEFIFNKYKLYEKCFSIYNYNNLVNQIDSNIENFDKLTLQGTFNEMEKLLCVVCLKNFFNVNNFMIFCDGCNYGIHKKCYGISYDVKNLKNWYCDVCNFVKNNNINNFWIECFFCKKIGSMMKNIYFSSRKKFHWVHLNCTFWLNHNFLNSINEKKTFNYSLEAYKNEIECYICKRKIGYKIKCHNKNCKIKYHAECQSIILSNIKGINFEIEDPIFYLCLNHNKELILKNSIYNFEYLVKKFDDFYNKFKIKNEDIYYYPKDLYDTNLKFTLRKLNEKHIILIPNKNMNENINQLLNDETKMEKIDNFKLYKEIFVNDNKFKLIFNN